MRLFRRTEFDALVAVTPQDLASSGAEYLLFWKEDALRKRQDNESTTDAPALPSSLASIPVSATSLVPDLPNNAAAPSAAASSGGSGLLGLSPLSLLPTASAEAAAASTPSPSATPSSSAATGGGLLGLGVGASVGLGGLLGGTSTPAAAPSTSIAPAATSVAPDTSIAAPTSVAPIASSQPATSVEPAPASSALPATSAAPAVTIPTTASQVAPTSVAPVESATAVPVVPSSSAIIPVQQSTSAAAIIPIISSSPATSIQAVSQASSVSDAPRVSSAVVSSAATGKKATLTQTDASSTFAISTISPSAAAELSDPTLASSMITRITKTGSVPGVTTETTASGIVVTETLKPSNSMSAGTMAGVIVGAAAGGLIIAALILFMVRKFMRIRRMAKAESPPPSPLLNAYNPPLSPAPPLRIEVGMHQRMRSNDSDFWVSGKGSSINEKEIDGHGYPMPISPLPSLREGLEMDGGMGRSNSGRANGGFKLFPNVDQNGEGKGVVARNF